MRFLLRDHVDVAESAVERAIAFLGRLDAVGTDEDFKGSILAIFKAFGLPEPKDVPTLNSSKVRDEHYYLRPLPEYEVSDEDRSAIIAITGYDQILYDFARKLTSGQRRSKPKAPQSSAGAFDPARVADYGSFRRRRQN